MQKFARFISDICNPLLMPSLGVFIALRASVLNYVNFGTQVVILLVVFGCTAIFPLIAIAVLHNLKYIEDKRLVHRKERTIPYIAASACYVTAFFYLRHLHAPLWLCMFIGGGALAAIIAMLINLKWKISAHTTGIGGVLALCVMILVYNLGVDNMLHICCAITLLCGLVGTARILLNRHSLLQVSAGFVLGFTCVFLAILIFG